MRSQAQIEGRLRRLLDDWDGEHGRDYSTEERRQLAKQGKAKPDLSFPIVDAEDVKNAVRLARSPSDRAWTKKRAAAVGASKLIPEEWAAMDYDAEVLTLINQALRLQEQYGEADDPNDRQVLLLLKQAQVAQEKDIAEDTEEDD